MFKTIKDFWSGAQSQDAAVDAWSQAEKDAAEYYRNQKGSELQNFYNQMNRPCRGHPLDGGFTHQFYETPKEKPEALPNPDIIDAEFEVIE